MYAEWPKVVLNRRNARDQGSKAQVQSLLVESPHTHLVRLVEISICELGLAHLDSSACVFNFNNIILICYVNDLLVLSRNMSYVVRLRRILEVRYLQKESGESRQFLNRELNWFTGRVFIRQENLFDTLLQQMCMMDCKPQLRLMSLDHELNMKCESSCKR